MKQSREAEPNSEVVLDVIDILSTYHHHGERDALLLLPWFLHAGTPLGEIQDLAWFEVAKNAYRLRVPVWCEIIRRLKGDPLANEKRAYYFNDLGMFLLLAGDPRSIQCFLSAMRLTKDVGRRIRTLARLGNAHSLLLRDWTRAKKFYGAAIALGEATVPDSRHLSHLRELRETLEELKHSHRGIGDGLEARLREAQLRETLAVLEPLRSVSDGFEARLREAQMMPQDFAGLLLIASVPSL